MDNPVAVPPAITGQVFNIQRFSIHDGPGIRTTVFLKGCPLHCLWCHNPESQQRKPELSFLDQRCIGCGYCFKACPRGAHRMADGRHILDRELCEACGICTSECYAGGLELVGKTMTVSEVITEVLKDWDFYQTSQGGMTLSGGEPLSQFEFTRSLLVAAREKGLHCGVDTSGYTAYEKLAALLPLTDLFLYDIKEMSDQRHRKLTGVSNRKILANLRRLHDDGARIQLRLPLIPELNDNLEHLQACGQLVHSLPHLDGVEVMPYHRLGLSKSGRLGYPLPSDMEKIPTPTPEIIERWLTELHRSGAPQARQG